MNPEAKRLWLEALRSGKYKQGKDALKIEGVDGIVRHCCLGVLCEIAVRAGVSLLVQPRVMGYGTIQTSFDEEPGTLPEAVRVWAGLEEVNPTISREGNVSLAQLNDRGATFAEIAEHIEREL